MLGDFKQWIISMLKLNFKRKCKIVAFTTLNGFNIIENKKKQEQKQMQDNYKC